jgi:hypothetical protein
MWFPPPGFRYHSPSGRTLTLTISIYNAQSAPTHPTGRAALNGNDFDPQSENYNTHKYCTTTPLLILKM